MSAHRIDIVELQEVLPHPNPDATQLELVKIYGWQCCVRKGDYKSGDRVAFVPPDYLVPTNRPEFSFLYKEGKSQERIKVKRLKGTISQGLVIPVPEELKGLPIGTNIIEQLGVERYEPPLPMTTGGDCEKPPSGYIPVYDIESFQRYFDLFSTGEEIVATEKINGCNARFVFHDGQMYCGSRTTWKKHDESNLWWRALSFHKEIQDFCEQHENYVIYGEVYGQVGGYQYNVPKGRLAVGVFDILVQGSWLSYTDATKIGSFLPWVPVVYNGPFDVEKLKALAESDSFFCAGHTREGVVVKPASERVADSIGRVQLKLVSNRYLEK